MSKKKQKCYPASQVWFWGIAGYIAYAAILYVWRKPACEYAQKMCEIANGQTPPNSGVAQR